MVSESSLRIENESLIEMSGVTKVYKNAAGSFEALKDINVTFRKGEFVGVIGKSGSGKSTLVNMITGIDHPTWGKVFVEGRDIHAMKESDQARWRGRNLGVVFQFFQLLPMLTLVENVLLPMDFCDVYQPDERIDRAMSLLDMVGLAEDAHKLPGAVAGGQQQSAAIARALANDPPIIIADEPTGNLDAKTADAVYDKFETLSGEGRTIIMITHDPEIEHRLSRKILLSDGEMIAPILVRTLPWLLRPDLRELGRRLEGRTYKRGDELDVRGRLVDQVMLIEKGEIKLVYKKKRKEHSVTISGDAYFAGPEIIEKEKLKQFSARVISDNVHVSILPWENLAQALDAIQEGHQRFQKYLRHHMLGKTEELDEEPGVIG